VISAPVIVSETGKKIVAHEHLWLTMVRIVLSFLIYGNLVIRSMATCSKGFVSIGTRIL